MSSPTSQQLAAITGSGNLLVVAGAGTGKTHTLIARCLRRVIEERVSLENILMVTFTEAAAAEMRGRLRSELLKRLDVVRSAFPLDEALTEHLAQQAALLDTARISTLHGFCLQLAREHFHELGLDPQFGVLDASQTAPLQREALDEILEGHYAGTDDRNRAVQSLIHTVGRGTDGKIRHLVGRLHVYSQSLPDPAGWLTSQEAQFSGEDPVEWRALFVQAVSDLRAKWQVDIAAVAGEAAALRLTATALEKLPSAPTLAEAQAVIRKIKYADVKANWPRGTVGKFRDPLTSFFDDAAFLGALLPDNGGDPLKQDWDWARGPMRALLQLAREFTDLFAAKKRELAGVDFADLEQFALRLLSNPDIANEWREWLEHVFVDEYQDINAAQDAILTALSRRGAEANRFLVGDVKQSIYRFRRANPKIFQNYHDQWIGSGETRTAAEGRALSLTENFRSREGLLNFINPLCTALMRREIGGVDYEPLEFGAPEKRHALGASPGADPCVELHLIAKPEVSEDSGGNGEDQSAKSDVTDLLAVEREARLVARRLKELRDGGFQVWDKGAGLFRAVRWSDMAVLLRSPGGRAEAFAKEFARAGVPLSAARDGFFASLEVSDLLSLLQLLDNPLQDVPLAAVLRSPLVGLSLEELVQVRLAQPKGLLWPALREFARQSNSAAAKALAFLDRFTRWRDLLRHTSLSQCLEAALTETHYEAHLLAGKRGPERAANVRQLLDLARQFDPYQRQGLYRFLRFVRAQEDEELDRPPAPPPATEAVRLVSIHKSKGLEYPVVAFAGLGTNFNESDLNETILLDEALGLCPKITPPGADQNYPGLTHWLARRHERRGLRGEELRLLYVALTRARDRLILVGTSRRETAALKWSTSSEPLATDEVLDARSHLDWLLQWLPRATCTENWRDAVSGGNESLTWRLHDGHDEVFAIQPTASETADNPEPQQPDAARLATLRARLNWSYPHWAAVEQGAKTTVTALRRQAMDELADEAQKFFQPRIRRIQPKGSATGAPSARLSAAAIGTAHHKFLQHVALDQTTRVAQLKSEGERLTRLGMLTEAEDRVLDWQSLAAFWTSECGRAILDRKQRVTRELPFTARLSCRELNPFLPPASRRDLSEDEFVVVQGTADLVVITPQEIWLLDFKTDHVAAGGLDEKVKHYSPQLQLYALALSRIYRRPVTRCWLHFLAAEETRTVPTGT